jgi:hypothetical protein
VEVLPYRADVESLAALIEERARGRPSGAARGPGLRGKALEGTTVAAERLGLLDAETRQLGERGRRFALAGERERAEIVAAGMREYAPYADLLGAVEVRGERVTDSEWLETWWGTAGYGNSPSNRREGVVSFGRFVEFSGLGRFVAGRRGHRSRIEWAAPGAGSPGGAARVAPDPAGGDGAAAEPAVPAATPAPPGLSPGEPPPAAAAPGFEPGAGAGDPLRGTATRVRLATGDIATLELPPRLPRAEKRRLLALVAALIEEEE